MNAYFVKSEHHWFLRGGSCYPSYDPPANGLLAFHATSGLIYDWYSSRVVVVTFIYKPSTQDSLENKRHLLPSQAVDSVKNASFVSVIEDRTWFARGGTIYALSVSGGNIVAFVGGLGISEVHVGSRVVVRHKHLTNKVA